MDKSNKKLESTIYNNYGKVAHSDRYRSQSKAHKPSIVSERKVTAPVRTDSAKKASDPQGKYKAVFALGMSRRKKQKQ